MNDTLIIENYLHGKLDPSQNLIVSARCLAEPAFHQKLLSQKTAYRIIDEHGRRMLRAEIRAAEHEVFTQARYQSFIKIIQKIFSK